ncbi:hypothetical protein ACF0H5_017244 [Mactra antiquata]
MVVNNNIMYQCKVFYIGSGSPDATKRGVEAIQDPLRQRYSGRVSDVEGFDVTVTIMPDAVHVQYTSGGGEDFSLPVATLSICAAVRCVESSSGGSNVKFVPVHSVITANEPDSEHPAIFSTVMRRGRDTSEPLMCHAFICNSTRDALHLVNATQTAHTALRRGYSSTGAMKFFIDQSTEFDRTIRLQSDSSKRVENRKIYMYQEDFDTRQYNADTRTYVSTAEDAEVNRINRVSTRYNENEPNTYYVKAGEQRVQVTPPVQHSETVLIKSSVEHVPAPTPPPQQTIIVDKPVIKQNRPPEYPPPKIIEREVEIEPPPMPKPEAQIIYVDKPVFKEVQWPEPPKPQVIEKPVVIEPPPPPKQEAQRIIVDRPVLKDWPKPPTPPPPIIQENPVYIEPPQWPEQKPQRIIVDKPICRTPPPCPPPPAPIVEERPVYIDPPDFPVQQPHRIVIEKPIFNPPKPAPRPPSPIIVHKNVYIEAPKYPEQKAQTIVVEKPIIGDPGPPPPQPKPIIIEKPVHIEPPKYQQQEPQRIIVEKPVMRDPGPPPPPPKPIIVEKIVYFDPPPWPKMEPQTIIVEKPVFRQRPPPPVPKPIIVEKPVYIDAPEPAPIQPQRIVVEKPVVRQMTYGLSETRRLPTDYNIQYQTRPTNIRKSYIIRSGPQVQGLRRYAYSDAGDDVTTGGYRIYGQPRDFREKQFMNERGFSRRINEEMRTTRGPGSYTYGAVGVSRRRGSTSS